MLKAKKACWVLSSDKTRKTEIMEFHSLKCSRIFMDTNSQSEKSLLGNFYMHQENNAPFPWTLLGHSNKNTDITNLSKSFVL